MSNETQYIPAQFKEHLDGCGDAVRELLCGAFLFSKDGLGVRPDTAKVLARQLPDKITTEQASQPSPQQQLWELCGCALKQSNLLFEAISIFESLYQHMLKYEQKTRNRVHKGMPLVWISECYFSLGYLSHAERFLFLTLCEDAIRDRGKVMVDGGVYFRAVRYHGHTDSQIDRYFDSAWKFASENEPLAMFPERVLFELDHELSWLREIPSARESGHCMTNPLYVRHLLNGLGEGDGKNLERLAQYLMGSIPGCRAYRRKKTNSSDHDVVGSFEGPSLDFRSDLGRYFLCECKDWDEPADFPTVAKLARTLDSVKSRFGVLFSKGGISGGRTPRGLDRGKALNAEREQLKVFASNGIAIAVIDQADLEEVAQGEDFLAILRSKYEAVRLDLS